MLKLATALVAALLFCSPTLAKDAKAKAPAPAVKCFSPDETVKKIGETNVLKRLDGDAAKIFVANATQRQIGGPPIPEGVETVLLLKRSDTTVLFAVFAKGCFVGFGGLPLKLLPALLEDGGV